MEIDLKTTTGDKILIIFLVIFSIIFSVWINMSTSETSDLYISIQVNGEELKTIEFTEEIIGKTFEIKTEFGRNVILIGDKNVRVIEASCPDKLDIKQGIIDKSGQMLVCLPNRLIIELKSRNKNIKEIDNVNY